MKITFYSFIIILVFNCCKSDEDSGITVEEPYERNQYVFGCWALENHHIINFGPGYDGELNHCLLTILPDMRYKAKLPNNDIETGKMLIFFQNDVVLSVQINPDHGASKIFEWPKYSFYQISQDTMSIGTAGVFDAGEQFLYSRLPD